jgi:hypothetical protein
MFLVTRDRTFVNPPRTHVTALRNVISAGTNRA